MYVRIALRIVSLLLLLVGYVVAMTVVQQVDTVGTQSIMQAVKSGCSLCEKEIEQLAKINPVHADILRRTASYYREMYFITASDTGERDYILNFMPVDDYLWEAEIAQLARVNVRDAQLLAQTDLYYRALYFKTPENEHESLRWLIPLFDDFTYLVDQRFPQEHYVSENAAFEALAKTDLRKARILALSDLSQRINYYDRATLEVVHEVPPTKTVESKEARNIVSPRDRLGAVPSIAVQQASVDAVGRQQLEQIAVLESELKRLEQLQRQQLEQAALDELEKDLYTLPALAPLDEKQEAVQRELYAELESLVRVSKQQANQSGSLVEKN